MGMTAPVMRRSPAGAGCSAEPGVMGTRLHRSVSHGKNRPPEKADSFLELASLVPSMEWDNIFMEYSLHMME